MVEPINYSLKFSISSRTLLKKSLRVVPWRGFGKATLDDFHQYLPERSSHEADGYMIRSVEAPVLPERAISTREGRLLYIMESFPRHMTRLEGSFDDFLASKSAKTRSTLRRKVRRFAELSSDQQLHWQTYRTPAEMQVFLDLALPLANTTYQARLFDGALPDTEQFRQKALALAAEGRVRAYLLFLDDKPVAYLYTPLVQGAYLYTYLGYDADLARMSPGTVLQFLVLEQLYEDKSADYFDFTEGEGPHKALFATESSRCCNALYLDNTRRNRWLVKLHYRWNRSIERLKQVLDRLKLGQRVRRLMKSSGRKDAQDSTSTS